MAYYDLNERAILAMSGRLKNNLNANIDAINAATVADATRNQTQIAYPALVLDAPPVPGQLTQFPIVAIADGNIQFVDDVGWGATGLYEMVVLAYVMDPDPEVLAWKLRRYAQAIITTAIVGRNVDYGIYSGAWGAILKRVVPGRRVARQDPAGAQQIMSWVGVVLELKDEQNAP